jgi:hypothetical protein
MRRRTTTDELFERLAGPRLLLGAVGLRAPDSTSNSLAFAGLHL